MSESDDKVVNEEMIKSFKEYQFTKQLIKITKNDDIMNNALITYLSCWILGISYGQSNHNTKDFAFLSQMVKSIITRFESLSGFQFQDSQNIFNHIYDHLRPAYYRLLFNLPITNPLTQKIKQEYKVLFDLVKESVRPIFSLFNGVICDDEIAYLTLHFSRIYTDESGFHKIHKKKH